MNTNATPIVNTKPRTLIESLILDNLGYCCLWVFFTRNKRTGMIALRLGVSDRAVRLYKARFNAGEFDCTNCGNCLKEKLCKEVSR